MAIRNFSIFVIAVFLTLLISKIYADRNSYKGKFHMDPLLSSDKDVENLLKRGEYSEAIEFHQAIHDTTFEESKAKIDEMLKQI